MVDPLNNFRPQIPTGVETRLNELLNSTPIEFDIAADSATRIAQVPLMDSCLQTFPLERKQGREMIEARYNRYADDANNGLSQMERELLRLQMNDSFYYDGTEIKNYESTRDIYNRHASKDAKNTPKPRFLLCHYSSRQLADLDNFIYSVRKAPISQDTINKYESQLIKLFNAVAQGQYSLDIDPSHAQEYREFFQRQIDALKKANEAKEVEEFKIRQLAIENYYIYHILPKELMRYGLVMGPSYSMTKGKTKQLRYLGVVMPSLSDKILANVNAYQKTAKEYQIPVNVYDSANATLDKRISQTNFDGGVINVNLISLESEITNELISAKAWKQRFDKAYTDDPSFKFEQDPRFLDQFLLLGFHGAASSEDNARTRILDANLEEQIAVALSRIYLENLFRQTLHKPQTEELDEEETFWAGIAQGRRDNVSSLFKTKNSSTIQEAYDKIEQTLDIGDTSIENWDASNVRRGLMQILNLEARLRALAKSTNPNYVLLKSLRNVIVPMQQENSSSAKLNSKAGHYGAEVILTKLLTEKLLGKEGEELCKQVNWEELLKMDFTRFELYSYQNFLKNPDDTRNDLHGLMKLRRAWYKFFDRELGGAGYEKKFDSFAKSSRVQDAARSLLKREFTSYEDRKMRDQVAYYNRHRSFGIPDKINDMAA